MNMDQQVRVIRESLRSFNRRAGVLKTDPYGIGLSLSQSSALVDLDRLGPLRPNDLVRRLNLEKSSVSRLVGVLKKKRLISIEDDPEDGRSLTLNLTKLGKIAVATINRISNESVLQAFRHLDRNEQSKIVNALAKLAHAAEKAEALEQDRQDT